MSDDYAIIAADVAVTSKRAGHVSLFAADLDAGGSDLKRFYADPTLLKQVVEQLKRDGFTVASISKFGVSIIGSKTLYEATFGVPLAARAPARAEDINTQSAYRVSDPADPANTWLIRPKTPEYTSLIDGIALSQPSRQLTEGGGSGPPVNTINLEDIAGMLSLPPTLTSRPSCHIVVIDSGFNARHPCFAGRLGPRPGQVSVNGEVGNEIYRSSFDAVQSWHFENEEQWSPNGSAEVDYNRLHTTQPRTKEEEAQYTRLAEERAAFHQIGSYIQRFKDVYQDEDDSLNGHGTIVVANILAVAPNVMITVIRDTYPLAPQTTLEKTGKDSVDWPLLLAFKEARKLKPSIICLCRVNLLDKATFPEERLAYAPLAKEISSAVREDGIVVLFGSGNRLHDKSGKDITDTKVAIQNFWEAPILVGGAHFEMPQPSGARQPVASHVGFGYPAAGLGLAMENLPTPHVSALCGPPEGYIRVPDGPQGWKYDTGTSLAAPQVAAVCAYILQAWPGARPTQVREILIRTATSVTTGKTAQGFGLAQIVHMLPNGDRLPTGLVNIRRAVAVAVVARIMQPRGMYSAEDLVSEATRYVKTKKPHVWG